MSYSIKKYFSLIRLHQYVKNLFVFMPLFFVGQIANVELLISAMIAFFSFSLSASAVYIINDCLDIDEDRKHPKKKYRPLASGEISKKNAIALMIALLIVGVSLMAILSIEALSVLVAYIVMNLVYSCYLKHIAILDITVISIGFVLRVFIGSLVTETPLSMWIVIMTFLLSLFMALAKRRDDVFIFLSTGKEMRKVIGGYNIQLIDSGMTIMASVIILAYIMYTTSTEVLERMQSDYLYLTALFVILGIMRYLQISFVENNSGSPTMIVLKDRFMQITILAWLCSFAWIIYL